ncbi:MAG: protein-export membrane protein SecF [Spirochaetes bacterium GWD1_27_9]|nr:MAG: protein-export membrane protein SecF [Spirochaetes bacterium GWB1_27_13]OHD22474.1 MAG: protein-export membrane protein SecF [Spirochaetes bacterium GWC1_27_15]OHD42827.1 MAG: protein-export membrane protein SecF [Spirochaetes bacterium GWD1_27_9]
MKTNINFIKLRFPAFIFSLTVILLGFWFILGPKNLNLGPLTPKGFNLGIDFQGGVVHQVTVYYDINQNDIRKLTEQAGLGNEVQQIIVPEEKRIGKAVSYLIKATITEKEQKEIKEKDITAAKFLEAKIQNLYSLIKTQVGNEYVLQAEELKKANSLYPTEFINGEIVDKKTDTQRVLNSVVKDSESVISPVYSAGLRLQAIFLVIFVLTVMLVYITIRFKIQFAIGAILALIHDTSIMLGFIAFFRLELDMYTIAAVLTIIGYSINDTIVVYDRIRENFGIMKDFTSKQIFNTSLNQTLNRTIVTSFSTQLAVIALLIWGGPKIFSFAFTLTVGILFGTYSSIFIAGPVVDIWENLFSKKEKAKILKEKKREEIEQKEEDAKDENEEQTTASNETITLSKSKLKKLTGKKK